ncbi:MULTISPECIES: S24 family peptidase [Streptococcus]|uniref:XRE family transcriptional regulator n=4 Tax=Streptococcus TaxID=1301 RepID=A0A3A4M6D4_9STRE|nr:MULTISPECIES: S24 family peptidase [Streptococcus]ETE03490.1 XRE family transcriptional regulator [Streptococcus pseudopneumoniae 22725]MBF9644671.1 helix-turn-helix transcriptional regulator [Streptococcus pseudopneumoniae]MBF9672375.1 helix-turn-helix transcriptional regulator [Streptococcus pseudopneumoniae]NIB86848.1 XRE family transcriptional regulator [Streptococcus pseudopneumoniae]RJP07553.1 XRE family transcriptional regulator [Streptococcus pseudopneumoniae]
MTVENKEIFANNLSFYMKQKGVDRNTLCADLDLKYTTVRDWLKGITYPRIGKIELLANYFNINKSDLIENKISTAQSDSLLEKITNTARKLNTDNKKIVLRTSEELWESQNEEETKINEVSEKVLDLYQVEVVSETAAASGFNYGFGYDDTDREIIEVDEQPPHHDIATKVSGDSMQPDYQDGDILYLVDKGLTTYNGDLAVIAYGDRSYFKKIYTENGRLRLVSLNDKYEDITLDFPPAEDTHIKIYAVIGVYRGE